MFDPLDRWLGIPPEEQPPDYYRLLGINPFASDEEAIRAAAEVRLAHMQTFAGGPHLREAKAISDLIAQARSVLLDGQRKSEYDERLREHLADQQGSSASKPPVVRVADPSPPPSRRRISHPRSNALCGVLSLLLVTTAGVLAYSGLRQQNPLARRESPKLEIAPGVATEEPEGETDSVASEPIEKPNASSAPPTTTGRTSTSEREMGMRVVDQDEEAGTGSPSPSDDTLDRQGVVQRIHVGLDPNLATVLIHELDSLVAGEALPRDDTVAARLYDGITDSQSMKGDPQLWKELSDNQHEIPEFTLMLPSGRTIELSDTFGDMDETFEQSLKERLNHKDAAMLRVNYDESGQTKLLISRRGKELHGPLFTFYDDGLPLAYANYRYGKRNSSLLTWDEQGRPFVFEQYRVGQRHGLRCLFKACADGCKTGHLWLVQEWDKGELNATHVVLQDGTTVSLNDLDGQTYQLDDETSTELNLATSELREFEQRLDLDETKLKKAVAEYQTRLRSVVSAQMKARSVVSQNRLRVLASTMGPVSKNLGRSMARTRIRNCGSS